MHFTKDSSGSKHMPGNSVFQPTLVPLPTCLATLALLPTLPSTARLDWVRSSCHATTVPICLSNKTQGHKAKPQTTVSTGTAHRLASWSRWDHLLRSRGFGSCSTRRTSDTVRHCLLRRVLASVLLTVPPDKNAVSLMPAPIRLAPNGGFEGKRGRGEAQQGESVRVAS